MAASSVAWIQIVIADIQNSRSGPLVLGFQTTALAAGQSDPVPAIISQVVEEILGCIGFSGRYTMDASYGTLSPNVLPPNLKDLAVEKICRKLKGRLNMPYTQSEQDDEKQYNARLNLIREGRWPIDVTNNPGNNLSVKGGTVATIVRNRSLYTRGGLSGLC